MTSFKDKSSGGTATMPVPVYSNSSEAARGTSYWSTDSRFQFVKRNPNITRKLIGGTESIQLREDFISLKWQTAIKMIVKDIGQAVVIVEFFRALTNKTMRSSPHPYKHG
ncbi:hypothetical protein F3Y22_tig00110831pilonHSYRG00588 [Hibiscus syriacus]|uniref:Uncharacterized protein n=1 Tax=Hibiscus syriacus TaxID=106335 RepID=A0A6A2ZMM3_HIBSY|nr:hypothetical protein F3Y22_tig00110831pilonHSYRG00588 [Hibiscus syriacus]